MKADFRPDGLEFTALNGGPDPAASRRVVQALLKMGKIDIAAPRKACASKEQPP